MDDERYQTSIPTEAQERPVVDKREPNPKRYRRFECVLNDKVVGIRVYDANGRLMIETPLKKGVPHGTVYTWYETGELELAEPYVNGQIHGSAKQWAKDGTLMGTYTLRHGSGYDVWRELRQDGTPYIAEVHKRRKGKLHGYQWWVNEDERTLYHELRWHKGKLHGIERRWDKNGRLLKKFPRFWIRGKEVRKPKYLRAARRDNSLPSLRKRDNRPKRRFPKAVYQ